MDKQVAIITGGAQGIGKGIAKLFLEKGITVIIIDHDEKAGIETQQEFKSLGNISFALADVACEDSVKKIIENTYKNYNHLDYLINNAGIFTTKPLEYFSLAEWHHVLNTNLTSAFLWSKYAAPFLKTARGAIVNIASTRALMSEPHTEAYAASKGGIVALSHALAISLGPDVRVNCISPGWIDTSEWNK